MISNTYFHIMLIQNVDVDLLTIFHWLYVLSPSRRFQPLPNESEAARDNNDGKILILRKVLFQYWGTFWQSFCHRLVYRLTRSWGTKPLENKHTYINYIWFDVLTSFHKFWNMIYNYDAYLYVHCSSVVLWSAEMKYAVGQYKTYYEMHIIFFLNFNTYQIEKHTKLYCPLK